jgi:hypothetical protein
MVTSIPKKMLVQQHENGTNNWLHNFEEKLVLATALECCIVTLVFLVSRTPINSNISKNIERGINVIMQRSVWQ